MKNQNHSLKQTARLAGILGLIMGIPLPFSLFYVPAKIFVSGDADATAKNLLTDESFFRAGIVGHLFAATTFLFLVFVLYKLFKPVNTHWARLMVALVVVQVPISFFIETCNVSALMLLKGDIPKAGTTSQIQDWSMLLLGTARYGLAVQQIFWGLWLLPYGLLVYTSSFIPRILGILLLLNGVGYLIEALTFLLAQRSTYELVRRFTFVTYFGEAAIMLFYLIKGVKTSYSNPIGYKEHWV